jgi:hypothetical protein
MSFLPFKSSSKGKDIIKYIWVPLNACRSRKMKYEGIKSKFL